MAACSFVYLTFSGWLFFGCLSCFNQAINIKRVDPGSTVNITWPVQPTPSLDTYDVINITVNNSDVMFSCLPAYEQCDVINTTRSNLRFVIIQEDHQLNDTDIRSNDVTISPINSTLITGVGFELKYVNITEAGVYSLIMVQGDNFTEQKVVIYVYQKPTKPTITGSLELHKVGEQLTLTCSDSEICSVPVAYRNLSKLVYMWYVDNRPTGNSKRTLIIRSLSKSDNLARYRCVVREENCSLAETESEIVTLDVAYVDGVRLEATDGDVSCTSDCNPECSHRWLDGDGRLLSNTSRLIPSEYINGARITCEASNQYGNDSASTFLVYVRRREPTLVVVLSSLIASCLVVWLAAVVHLCRHRRRRRRRRRRRAGRAFADRKSTDFTAGEVFDRYTSQRRMSSEQIGSIPSDVGAKVKAPTDTQPAYVNDVNDGDRAAAGQVILRKNSTLESRQHRKVIHTLDFDDYYTQTSA